MTKSLPIFSRLRQFFRDCLCWDKPFARNVFLVALPMVLQSLVESSLHIVDGLMVSGLGDIAYSAVTQANRFSFVFNLFSVGAFTGGAIYLSQYWGARDIKKMRWSMGVSMLYALLIAAVFTLAGMLFPRQIVACFLKPGESFELAVKYLRIVAPGYLFSAISGVYGTTIKSGEKTHLPMISGMAGIGVNTLLNYVLIFGKWGFPKLGVEGAALATVIAAFVSMILNLCFAYGMHLPAGARILEWIPREKGFASQYIKTTVPVIFNEGLWGLGTTMYSVFYGRMGDNAVATMGVCNTINDLVWVIIFALMNATAIIIGKTLGTGNRERAYLYAKRLIAGSMLSGLILGALVIFFKGPMVNLFSGLSQQVRSSAETILVIGAATIWFRAFNTVNIVGVLRSGGDTVFSLAMDAGTLWLIGVPFTGLAALVFHWPLEIVFLCTLSEEIVKMLIGMPRFKSRKWMNVLTEAKENEYAD
ncbi:MAG: MATE family efflux transporter [Clostridiales bacterium]|nr:MATE family efflux transporter [Clostridiales bacterium]